MSLPHVCAALVVALVCVSVGQEQPSASRATVGAPGAQAGCAPTALPDATAAAINALVARSGAEVGLVFTGGCRELRINPDLRMHAASTMKIPVMIELFRQVDAGTRALDDTLVVSNTFTSVVDGSPFTLNAADDADKDTYAMIGQRLTLREACERMITVSSNITTNLLIDELGIDRIRAAVAALGAEGMDVRRKVEDGPAFRAGLNNTTTAAGLASLLDAIHAGRAASSASTREMLAILSRQTFTAGIPAGVPPGTQVAHKTGTITKVHHDAGIVLGDVPFVVVVLTRGLETEKDADALIAAITRILDLALRAR